MKKFVITIIVLACAASLVFFVGQAYPQYNVMNLFSSQEVTTSKITGNVEMKSYVECGINVSFSTNQSIEIKFTDSNQSATGMVVAANSSENMVNGSKGDLAISLNSNVKVKTGESFTLIYKGKTVGTGKITKTS